MPQKISEERKHPVESASLINQLFFWWTIRLFKKGSKDGLTMDDIWPPLSSDKSEQLANKLEKAWNQQLQKCEEQKKKSKKKNSTSMKPNLTTAIIKVFGFHYFIISFIAMLEIAVLRNALPIFQSSVISYFDMSDQNSMSENEVLIYATGLVLTAFCTTLTLHHTLLQARRIGMKIRVACSSLIYRKSLKLSKASINGAAVGQAVNLLSNDVHRFDHVLLYFNLIWIAPFQIILAGLVMWQSIGIHTLVALGCLILTTIPLQLYLSKISGKLRGLVAKLTDQRIQLLSELIAGIKVVKMYAWEKPFNKIISQTRKMEIEKIHYSSNIKGFYTSLSIMTQRITLFVTIVSFVSAGNPLNAGVVFQLFSYLDILNLIMVLCLPTAIMSTGEALESIKRIQEFLELDEINKDFDKLEEPIETIETCQPSNKQPSPVHIELNRVFANWIIGQLPPTLNDVSLKIKGGELCCLVGPVGSGKSSLLNLLLQELPIGAGAVRLYQDTEGQNIDLQSKRGFFQNNSGIKISYASQDPWLFTGTVRENIVFGQDYYSIRYQEVTKVCSLLQDFQQLPNGDMTIVGERGMSLSGGQRARINLARAIYREADIYLLDDPLSAVDVRVGRQLFGDCISEYLKGKTRILATHQIYQLKEVDIIAVMERGMIKAQGSFETLTKTSADFNNMLNRLKENIKESDDIITEKIQVEKFFKEEISEKENLFSTKSSPIISKTSVRFLNNYQHMSCDQDKTKVQEKQESEAKESGNLSYKVYLHYFRNGGNIFTLISFTFIWILSQVAISGTDYWLSYWTNLESIKTCIQNSSNDCKFTKSQYDSMVNTPLLTSLPFLDENGFLWTKYAIYIHFVFIIACIILIPWRSFFLVKICMNASRRLHESTIFNILHATMHFFNVNPSGRVLNRLSKDMGTMDESIPISLLNVAQIFFVLMGILVLIFLVNLWMIIPSITIAVLIYVYLNYHLHIAQDVKRLEGIAKSPVFTHVSATLRGLTTIRNSGHDIEMMFRKKFDELQDDHSGAWYLVMTISSALGFAIDSISCILICCVCYSFILIGPEHFLGASVGLAISQSLLLTGIFQYGVKQNIELQFYMTSVERILQYTDLPKENFETVHPSLKCKPFKGHIQFENVSLKYNKNDPAVLKDITVTIKPGWKVGIVGRTGAGKSSLISALLRLVDVELLGKILIDDRDIKEINLHYLRSNISIIPQEPVLFSETLRYNLDPFGIYSDTVIWDALKEVELNDLVLDQRIAEGGTNFSVGQRQLICLARALLRENKILVLDEATANIDSRTDALIQRAIRSKFTGCTVIMIAHRLNTIIDSDRVLVLDAGRVIEFDSPYELIFNRPNSLFKQMVEQTSHAMAEKLYKEVATYHHQNSISIQSLNNEDDKIAGINGKNKKKYDDTTEDGI